MFKSLKTDIYAVAVGFDFFLHFVWNGLIHLNKRLKVYGSIRLGFSILK